MKKNHSFILSGRWTVVLHIEVTKNKIKSKNDRRKYRIQIHQKWGYSGKITQTKQQRPGCYKRSLICIHHKSLLLQATWHRGDIAYVYTWKSCSKNEVRHPQSMPVLSERCRKSCLKPWEWKSPFSFILRRSWISNNIMLTEQCWQKPENISEEIGGLGSWELIYLWE